MSDTLGTQEFPPHILRPELRPIRIMPLSDDQGKFLGLRLMDPYHGQGLDVQIPSPQHLQGMQALLQCFRGQHTVHEIAEQLQTPEIKPVTELANALEARGLLWGPTSEDLETKMREQLRKAGAFPATVSRALGEDEAACRAKIESILAEADDPELEGSLAGIVVTHLDYERGRAVYATSYKALSAAIAKGQQFDRVVILATPHLALGDGVTISDVGFDTSLGRCPADLPTIAAIRAAGEERMFIDLLDLCPEHSVQCHVPWIQAILGNVPIVGAILPDPTAKLLADDGKRATVAEFVTAMQKALGADLARTLFIISAELAHVGPQFGDAKAIDDTRKKEVNQLDRSLLKSYIGGDGQAFLGAVSTDGNPLHWDSLGALWAGLTLLKGTTPELLDYYQSCEADGSRMVSAASLAFVR
ncbi:MAG: AmmeMemoRadiSam system protein B [Phycisphaerales bacterium]|nr:AmmeMemoRadiSam system protein B [Phycisphaerales bacterium]